MVYKLAAQQRILENFNNYLRKRLLKKRYFMPWEVSWFPTYKCNLKCSYCNSNPIPMLREDAERAVRKIIELKPASLSILGGEPFIVPGISDCIEKIVKALPDIFIMLTTNGMVKQEHIEKAARYLYSFCFSMDGLGEYQKKYRGGDPELILKNVKAASRIKHEYNPKMDLVVNTVVTKHNIKHLPEFFEYLHEIDPSILCFGQAMLPFESPESLGDCPEVVDEFLEKMLEMKRNGIRILLAGRIATKGLNLLDKNEFDKYEKNKSEEKQGEHIHTRITDRKLHVCYQEAFNTFIDPAGNEYTCRSYSAIYLSRLVLRTHNLKHSLAIWRKNYREFVTEEPVLECKRFGGCPEWMNAIITSKSIEDLPSEIFRIKGRLSPERVEESVEWINKHVNPDFKREFIE